MADLILWVALAAALIAFGIVWAMTAHQFRLLHKEQQERINRG